MLPVEAQSTAFAPSSIALATATTMPRSLNEPVGLQLSSLKYSSSMPRDGPMCCERTSGVLPSPRLMRGVASVSGRNSAYRSMTPGRVLLLFGKVDGTSAYVPYLFLQGADLALLMSPQLH